MRAGLRVIHSIACSGSISMPARAPAAIDFAASMLSRWPEIAESECIATHAPAACRYAAFSRIAS